MKRMYGDFEMTKYGPQQNRNKKRKRHVDEDDFTVLPELLDLYGPPGGSGPDPHSSGDSYFNKLRNKRQSSNFNRNSNSRGSSSSQSKPSTTNNNESNSTGR